LGVVAFVLVMTVRPLRAEGSTDAVVVSKEAVMQIRNLLASQNARIAEEQNNAAYWYNKFKQIEECVLRKAQSEEPAAACLDGHTAL